MRRICFVLAALILAASGAGQIIWGDRAPAAEVALDDVIIWSN